MMISTALTAALSVSAFVGPAMSTARVSSGPAPLFVSFDVFNDGTVTVDADNGSGDPDPAIGYWLWDFGDYGAGAWSTTGKAKNSATGMVAGHVYEWPGSYVASLKHWNASGTLTTYTQTITVTDPDTVYTTTLYYSSTGNDSNTCTIASPCLTATQALGTGAKGVFGAAGPRRVLFKRGETFAQTSASTISSLTGPYHVGTYGDPEAADPVVNVSVDEEFMTLAGSVTGVRVVDINISGDPASTLNQLVSIGSDSLFYRCTLNEHVNLFSMSDALGPWVGSGIVECTVGPTVPVTGNILYWAQTYQSHILGNELSSTHAAGTGHVCRVYSTHGSVAHNRMTIGQNGHHLRIAGFFVSTGLTNDTFTGSLTGWTAGANWTSVSNTANHAAGSTEVLSQTITNGETGVARSFNFTVSNVTAGSVTLRYGGTLGTARSTNASFTEFIKSTSGALLEFVPTSDFDGRVDFTATSSRKFMDTSRFGTEQTEWLEYTWVTDNISEDISVGPTTSFVFGVTSSGNPQKMRNCVIERNRFENSSSITNCMELDGTQYLTARNNVFDLTARLSGHAMTIRRSGANSYLPLGNQAINNTIYSGGAYTGGGIRTTTDCTDAVVRNNHLIKDGGAGTVTTDTGTNTTITDSATDTALTGALASALLDFRPSATSNAIGTAFNENAGAIAAASYCRDTQDRITRFTTRNDAGAFEIGFTQTAPATMTFTVGVNADDLDYDSPDYEFVDRMKQSGNTSAAYGWKVVDDGTFGANSGTVTNFIDRDGWPKVTIPYNDGDGLAVLEKRFRSPVTGTHTVYFDGAGTLAFSGACDTATITTTGSTINVTAIDTDIVVRLTITNVSNLIKNIRCVMPGYEATYTTAPFYPNRTTKMAAIQRAGVRPVERFMKWGRTNGTKPTTPWDTTAWENRPTLRYHTQASSLGVAWEYRFRHANAIGADPYICVPHQASTAYVRSLAQLALGEVSTDAILHIELSNEASWNGSFAQTGYYNDLGQTLGFTGADAAQGRKTYCKTLAEVADIFLTEWGEANSHRLRFVLGTQSSSTSVTNELADYYEEVTIDSIPVNPHGTKVHAFVFAPYFGLHTSTGDRFGDDAVDEGWYLTDTAAQGVARIPTTYRPVTYTQITNQIAAIGTLAAVSSKPYTGVKAFACEAGPNLTSSGANQANANLTTFIQTVSRHNDMFAVCRDYLSYWQTAGGTGILWYHLAGGYSGTDSYGALEHIDASTLSPYSPKYRALIGGTAASEEDWKIRRGVRFPFFRAFRGRR